MLDGLWLDQPATTLFDNRARADKVIRLCQVRRRTLAAEQLEQRLLEQARDQTAGRPVMAAPAPMDTGYEATYKALAEAVHFVSSDRSGERTIRRVLESVGGSGGGEIVGDLMLLERRDEGWRKVLDRELAPLMVERVDARGQVLLDQGDAAAAEPTVTAGGRTVVPLRADIGKVLADPQEFERRLARARATGAYDGTDASRERFATVDRQNAEAGIDHVRSLERPRELAAARAKANGVAQRLDNAISQGSDHASKMKLLEAELAELKLLDTEPATEPDGGLRLLDATSLPRVLDDATVTDAVDVIDIPPVTEGQKRLLEQMAATTDEGELAKLHEAWWASRVGSPTQAPTPSKPAPDPKAPPPGVHPRNHELHKRVVKLLEAEGLPQSQYPRMLEQLLAEGRGLGTGGQP